MPSGSCRHLCSSAPVGLTGFDFPSNEVNEAMVRQLHRSDFIDGANKVVLIGGPGTGKNHIATALLP